MRRFTLAITALLVASTAAAAQEISPGFTRAQVEARLGAPAAARTVGDYTYLFYQNGCEIKCGQHDLVVLKEGKVTDAMFRSPKRHYAGTSSAPDGKPHGPTERTTPSSRNRSRHRHRRPRRRRRRPPLRPPSPPSHHVAPRRAQRSSRRKARRKR